MLPGSHRLDVRVVADLLHGPAFRDEATARDATRALPAHMIVSRPGDGIVIDEHLWHASVDGHNRHQWSAGYVLDPDTAEEELAVGAYLSSQFLPDDHLDYDPTDYPHYGVALRGGSSRWLAQLERLERLGARAAAVAEQRAGQGGARR